MKKRKKIFVSVICLSVVAVLAIALGIFINSIKPKTYSTAKIESEKVLSKYQTEMEEISNDLLKSRKNELGNFNEWFYICYPEENFVKIELDGQSMLGGQYWDLVIQMMELFMAKPNHTYMKKLTEIILLEQKKLTNIGGIFGLIMTERREVTNKIKKISVFTQFFFGHE